LGGDQRDLERRPSLTIRNVAAFALVSVGCFGLGVGFYGNLPNGRDLFVRHVFWASVLSTLVILIPYLSASNSTIYSTRRSAWT
jgi:hypothetical protein